MLHDGLCQALGRDSVYDAVYCPHLFNGRIGIPQRAQTIGDETGFDLLVINCCFNREHDWHYPATLAHRLSPGGKVAFIEGWDGANELDTPQMPVDAVFRRELDPSFSYPYEPIPLSMAAPEHWLDEANVDPFLDVLCAITSHPGHQLRWDCLRQIFATAKRHNSLVTNFLHQPKYFDLLARSRICICPHGAAMSDCVRTWEASSRGSIPLFVAYPPWKRSEPWFDHDTAFFCGAPDEIPLVLDDALCRDLAPMRRRLLDFVREYHTTRARALQFLSALRMKP